MFSRLAEYDKLRWGVQQTRSCAGRYTGPHPSQKTWLILRGSNMQDGVHKFSVQRQDRA